MLPGRGPNKKKGVAEIWLLPYLSGLSWGLPLHPLAEGARANSRRTGLIAEGKGPARPKNQQTGTSTGNRTRHIWRKRQALYHYNTEVC